MRFYKLNLGLYVVIVLYVQFVTTVFYCMYMCMIFVHSCIWQLFFLKNKRWDEMRPDYLLFVSLLFVCSSSALSSVHSSSKVEATPSKRQCRSNFRLCKKNCLTCSIRQCCFDIVAGVDGTFGMYYTRVLIAADEMPPMSAWQLGPRFWQSDSERRRQESDVDKVAEGPACVAATEDHQQNSKIKGIFGTIRHSPWARANTMLLLSVRSEVWSDLCGHCRHLQDEDTALIISGQSKSQFILRLRFIQVLRGYRYQCARLKSHVRSRSALNCSLGRFY